MKEKRVTDFNTTMLKVYVDENNQATFICPYCGFEKRFDASSFKGKKKNVKIKCKCGKPSEIQIEFRRYIRKQVNIIGTCTVRKTKQKHDILVKDLSQQGIGIEFMFGDRKTVQNFDQGDGLKVEFVLDDAKGTLIARDCIIRSVRKLFVGAEFDDENYTKQLGFYIMS